MWLQRWFRHKPETTEVEADPAGVETVLELRRQALTMTAADAGMARSIVHKDVWGMVMEAGYPEAVATLVAIGDGTTSLYLSTGGGVVGAGIHTDVRTAAAHFIATAEEHLDAFAPAVEAPMPELGRVRFYARTFDGTLAAEGDPAELGAETHPLAPVYHAGQALLTAVRESSARRPA